MTDVHLTRELVYVTKVLKYTKRSCQNSNLIPILNLNLNDGVHHGDVAFLYHTPLISSQAISIQNNAWARVRPEFFGLLFVVQSWNLKNDYYYIVCL